MAPRVVGTRVSPEGRRERRVPREGIENDRHGVPQQDGPEIDPDEEACLGGLRARADLIEDQQIQEPGEQERQEAVEKARHGWRLLSSAPTRGACTSAEYSLSTRRRPSAPMRLRRSPSSRSRSSARTHSSSVAA